MKKVYIYYDKKDYKYYLILKLKLLDKYEIVDSIENSDRLIVIYSKNLLIDIKEINKPYLVIYANNKEMKNKKNEKFKDIHIFVNDMRIIQKWLDN